MSFVSIHHRIRAAGVHASLSALVAALVALLVFKFWYPPPFSLIAGGIQLFLLLVSVDVVMGPALTAVAASPGKPRHELVRDLVIIVLLQLTAFGYGLHSVALARPVALVFEIDLLRVVTSADIQGTGLQQAPESLRRLSWVGPKQIAVVKPTDPDEQLRSFDLSMAGIPLAAQPRYWRDYADYAAAAWDKARPISTFIVKYPETAADVKKIAMSSGRPVNTLRFLPLQGRNGDWVALLANPGARVVGYLPRDGFF